MPYAFEKLDMSPAVFAGKRLRVGIDEIQYSWPEGRHLAEKLLDLFHFVQLPAETEVSFTGADHRRQFTDISLSQSPLNWEVVIASELFCTNDSLEMAFQVICALLQYFRQSAHYNENVRSWLARKGVIHVREVVFDPDRQGKLNKQLAETAALSRKLIERIPVN